MFFKKLSLVTGGFDPIHSGHIAYFERAKDLSGYLVVGINTDIWLKKKKGQYFQSWVERAEIIRHLDMVDAVITVPDNSEGSACGAIEKCLEISEKVFFCNGGDRGKNNTPENVKYDKDSRVKFEYSIGGDEKMNSSSWILRDYFERQRKLLGI
tara:strand:- start:20 stop:481 length:462 start_codon:yes stop_codon:yes gene_type:complete